MCHGACSKGTSGFYLSTSVQRLGVLNDQTVGHGSSEEDLTSTLAGSTSAQRIGVLKYQTMGHGCSSEDL